MTSLKQIEANRFNARKSTGPRTEQGKRRSRCNAVRHGLTAETVITALENASDYSSFEATIALDFPIRSAAEHELVSRLASVLWRLRRSTGIETGLFQIQAELMKSQGGNQSRRSVQQPEWYDEFDVGAPTVEGSSAAPSDRDRRFEGSLDSAKDLACCFLRVSRLQYGTFELLNRYETGLWRQAAQLMIMLQSAARR